MTLPCDMSRVLSTEASDPGLGLQAPTSDQLIWHSQKSPEGITGCGSQCCSMVLTPYQILP
jgi:hypothetical protein